MKTMTSAGRMIDMGAIAAKHERMVAVGNARMNARGDRIGAGGAVTIPAEKLAAEYNKANPRAVRNVGLKSAGSEIMLGRPMNPEDRKAAVAAAVAAAVTPEALGAPHASKPHAKHQRKLDDNAE